MGNISRMKVQGTVAVSRLVGGIGGTQVHHYDTLSSYTNNSATDQQVQFREFEGIVACCGCILQTKECQQQQGIRR